MNADPLRTVTPEEIAAYHEDGVVMLSGLFDQDWISLLEKASIRTAINQLIVRVYGIVMQRAGPCSGTVRRGRT